MLLKMKLWVFIIAGMMLWGTLSCEGMNALQTISQGAPSSRTKENSRKSSDSSMSSPAEVAKTVNTNLEKFESQIQQKFPEVPQITVTELQALLTAQDASLPILLDVREIEEYKVSHLFGAFHIDPKVKLSEFEKRFKKDQAIILYCSVGYRSSELALNLIQKGYQNVSNLKGSIFRWRNLGYPVFRGTQQEDKVHPYDKKWGKLLLPRYRSKI